MGRGLPRITSSRSSKEADGNYPIIVCLEERQGFIKEALTETINWSDEKELDRP